MRLTLPSGPLEYAHPADPQSPVWMTNSDMIGRER